MEVSIEKVNIISTRISYSRDYLLWNYVVHFVVSNDLKENICFNIIYGSHEIRNYRLPSKSDIETVELQKTY